MPEIKENAVKSVPEVKLLTQILCHSEDESCNATSVRNVKKPPIVTKNVPLKKESAPQPGPNTGRVRSASAGRDKRSELQSRYWSFLFGNLNRSIDELYTTVECYGSMSSCKEVILVLENYIRDFKSLAEWFQVSLEYENTPLPQRPQSLAWEVRKSNPVPRVRIKTLASPKSISGKSSPNYSGKNSPCPIIEENINSPRRTPSESKLAIISHNNAGKQGSKELIHINHTTFENLTNGEIVCHDLITLKSALIPENVSQDPVETQQIVEQINLAVDQENNVFNCVMDVIRLDKSSQTDLPDGDLTLAEYLEKYDKCLIGESVEAVPKLVEKEIETMQKTVELPQEEKRKPVTAKYSSVVSKNLPSKVNTGAKVGHQGILKKSVTVPGVNNRPTSNVVPTKTHPTIRQTRSVKLRDTLGAPKNVENRLSARSKTMIEMNSNKSNNNNVIPTQKSRFSGLSRLSKSRESLGSSTSTLKASTDRLNKSSLSRVTSKCVKSDMKQSSSSETITGNDSGWQTVKNRRRFSSHWANRFNQPSGYASLPSLALLNEEKAGSGDASVQNDATKTKITPASQDHTKKKLQKPVTTQKLVPAAKKSTVPVQKPTQPEVEKTRKINSAPTTRTPTSVTSESVIKRQKSDLTGLKLKSLRKEYLRSEKLLLQKSSNNSPEKRSATKMDPSSGSNSQTDDEKQCESTKIDMKIQTGSEIINKLYTACLGHHKCLDRDISSCDDEREESDDDQKKFLEAKQESLEREIRELENTEIDVDTETDETDCEALDLINTDDQDSASNVADGDEDMTLEDRYEAVLCDMSWVERLETLATLQAIHARHPGRAQQLHQKLSNPSRCLSLTETLKKYQAKQTRALEKRQALQKDKAVKIQNLLARVEEVKNQKQQLIDQKRIRMESRLQRATENRTQYLRDKIRKAHDEEEKLREIAFIKSLEAQNKRIDFMESCREQEGRLQDLEQERIKRMEEKAAKEAAVEKRRLELEAQRQQRLEKMSETRREREKRVGKLQAQRQQQRQHLAREKAKDREIRLQALQAQQIATTEELQRKIQQKQQESARRHEENIEHIRQRALEMTIPIRSGEETPQPGQRPASENAKPSKYCSDKSKELVKSARKRLKKIKQRMTLASAEYLAEMQPLPAHVKKDSQVHKLLNMITKGGGPLGIERPLGQLLRQIAKAEIADFQSMWLLDGLGIISNVIQKGMQDNSDISKRAVVLSVQLYRNSCSSCPQIARHAILGNTITVLFDALLISLQNPEEKSPLYPVELSTELILACTVALSPSNSLKQANPKVLERLPDLISYTVATGLVDILAKRCHTIHESVENQQSVVLSLLATIGLLTKLAELCPKGAADTTKFLSMLKPTELFGAISLLYSTIVPIGECIPKRTVSLAAATYNLLVTLASLDVKTFQEIMGDEPLSLQFFDVVTILLKYCVPKCHEKGETQAVIIDLIATLGFFCANNKENQNLLINSEQSSIIIKSLTKLPKEFDMVIYPTLVTIIHENPDARQLLSKDFNVELLEEFKASDMAKKNKIVSLLLKPPDEESAKVGNSNSETPSSSSVASSLPSTP